MSKVGRFLQLLIIVIIFFFMGKIIYQNWEKVSSYEWNVKYTKLGFSVIMLLVANFFAAVVWNKILRKIGVRLDYTSSMAIWFISRLYRYLPGKIWGIVGRIYLCEKHGISRSKAGVSIILEQSYVLITGILTFLISLPFWQSRDSLSNITSIFFAFPVVLIFLHPWPLTIILNPVLKWMKRSPIEIRVSFRNLIEIFLLCILFWAFWGFSFFIFVNSIYPIEFSKIIIISGIFAISFVIGYLSIIVPMGLGIREGIMSLLLNSYMPITMAIIISLLCRVWLIVVELLGISLILIVERNYLNKLSLWVRDRDHEDIQ